STAGAFFAITGLEPASASRRTSIPRTTSSTHFSASSIGSGSRQLLEERRGHVALAGVGEDDDDVGALALRTRGEDEGGGQRGARRDAAQEPLFAGEAAGVLESVVLRDRDDLVDDRAIQVLGDEAGADALDGVIADFLAGEDCGLGRLDGDD